MFLYLYNSYLQNKAPYVRAHGLSFVPPSFGFARCNVTASSSMRLSTLAIHSVPHNEPVVSAEWLHANLKEPDVKVYLYFHFRFVYY